MPEHDHELAIESDGGEVSYYFEAVGAVSDVSLENADDIGEKSVSGSCWNHTDVVGFNTAPKQIVFEEGYQHASLELDDEPVEPFHINMRTLKVTGHGEKSPYRFAVHQDGRIIGTGGNEWNDYVTDSGTSARGVVVGGTDVWNFWGLLTAWPDSNKKLTVQIDEKEWTYEGNPPIGVL